MSYERCMGFLWGLVFGFNLAFGVLHTPVFILLSGIPLFGVWCFRHNGATHEQ